MPRADYHETIKGADGNLMRDVHDRLTDHYENLAE